MSVKAAWVRVAEQLRAQHRPASEMRSAKALFYAGAAAGIAHPADRAQVLAELTSIMLEGATRQ